MNIIVTALPQCPKEELNEVVKLLNTVPGTVKFIKGETIPTEILQLQIKDYSLQKRLSFGQYWEILNMYRIINKIPTDNYAVLISPNKHDENWFSGFNGHNIFVDSNDWEYFSDKDSKYGIAFQIVENIIQSLMKLNIDNIYTEPNIHKESIGCINDFCGNKKDIMFKLRQGYICDSCVQRILSENIDIVVISHLKSIIDSIRNSMVDNFSLILNQIPKEPICVDKKGILTIGKHKISLGPQPKSLYYLFLNHLNGILTNKLDEYKEDLTEIYVQIKYPPTKSLKNRDKEEIKDHILVLKQKEVDEIVKKLFENDYGYKRFLKEKNSINKEINQTVGEKLAEFYMINTFDDSVDKYYKINIQKEIISMDQKYILKKGKTK